MGIILGIDIGCSTTKVVGLRQDGTTLGMLRTKGEDQLTSLFGAMGSFIASNQLSLHDIDRICLTGQGHLCGRGHLRHPHHPGGRVQRRGQGRAGPGRAEDGAGGLHGHRHLLPLRQ